MVVPGCSVALAVVLLAAAPAKLHAAARVTAVRKVAMAVLAEPTAMAKQEPKVCQLASR